jgi:LmbE family N-acetylglucosaminyl deacetylase
VTWTTLLRGVVDRAAVVLLSPHLDDVAYSCGGLVDKELPNSSAVVVTVFSRSAYVSSPPLYSTADITRIRQREDRSYCSARGLRQCLVQCADSSLSGYSDETEILDMRADDHRGRTVSRRLNRLTRLLRPELIIGPAGLGNHVDHVLVSDWLLRTEVVPPSRRLFYEDIPYVASIGTEQIEEQMERRGFSAYKLVDITDFLAQKLDGMATYVSQIDAESTELMKSHAGRIHGRRDHFAERFWSMAFK